MKSRLVRKECITNMGIDIRDYFPFGYGGDRSCRCSLRHARTPLFVNPDDRQVEFEFFSDQLEKVVHDDRRSWVLFIISEARAARRGLRGFRTIPVATVLKIS